MPDESHQSDHDILISFRAEVTTKLDRAIGDIKELKDNVAARVDILEKDKADATTTRDHERRIRFLERYVWIAIGALGLIQLLGISYIVSLLQHK